MTVGNIRLEVASLWVQIWGAPFDMVSPQVVKEVEEVEWKKKKGRSQNVYARPSGLTNL